MQPAEYDARAEIDRILFDAETIQTRVGELAAQVRADYLPCWQSDPSWNLLVISVLRGGIFFVTDLTRALQLPAHIDFVAIAQYKGRSTSGSVRIIKDLEDDIEGRDVLIAEDIIDTGLTLGYLLGVLRARKPRSIKVATLLDRPFLRIVGNLPVCYTGFSIGNEFVVGYGLDYQERYRNLPYIGIPREEVFRPES